MGLRRTASGRLAGVAGALAVAVALAAGAPAAPSKTPPARHRAPHTGAYYATPAFWRARMRAAVRYVQRRQGSESISLRVRGRLYGYRMFTPTPSASVLKAMLLVSYLDMARVRNRSLRSGARTLLAPMIQRSDNGAAGQVLGIVGTWRLQQLARRVGMVGFHAVSGIWGLSSINAAGQSRFFLHIDRFVLGRHRAYAMHLLSTITPSQRWGFGRVVPRGWRIYFKGGWGSGTGWVDHQVALLRKRRLRVALAVLTRNDGSHAYGKRTLRGVASILLRRL